MAATSIKLITCRSQTLAHMRCCLLDPRCWVYCSGLVAGAFGSEFSDQLTLKPDSGRVSCGLSDSSVWSTCPALGLWVDSLSRLVHKVDITSMLNYVGGPYDIEHPTSGCIYGHLGALAVCTSFHHSRQEPAWERRAKVLHRAT